MTVITSVNESESACKNYTYNECPSTIISFQQKLFSIADSMPIKQLDLHDWLLRLALSHVWQYLFVFFLEASQFIWMPNRLLTILK